MIAQDKGRGADLLPHIMSNPHVELTHSLSVLVAVESDDKVSGGMAWCSDLYSIFDCISIGVGKISHEVNSLSGRVMHNIKSYKKRNQMLGIMLFKLRYI